MKDTSATSDEHRRTSRRVFLASGLAVGVAAAVGQVATAAPSETAPHRGTPPADGGVRHASTPGGLPHAHSKLSHNHALMAHGLDARTGKYVDTGNEPRPYRRTATDS